MTVQPRPGAAAGARTPDRLNARPPECLNARPPDQIHPRTWYIQYPVVSYSQVMKAR